MPVRYDIAAQVPQSSGGGFDPMNMMAALQGLDYRQRQNALADMQMQKLQYELQQQNALRSALGGLDINSPEAVSILSRGGNLSEALSVMGAQRQAEALRAQEAAQRAAAANQSNEADIRRQRLNAELPGLIAGASKAQIDKSVAELARLQTVAANVLQNGGKNFEDLRKFGQGTGWDAMIGDKYDPDRIRALATQAATVQEYLKPQMGKVAGKEGQIRPALSPREAPVFTETMVQDVDAGAPPPAAVEPEAAPAAEPSAMKGRLTTDGLPVGRGGLLTQREASEKTGREENSKIFEDLHGLYNQLAARKAMPSTSMTAAESLRAVAAGSRAGQEGARVLDPESQRLRDEASTLIDQWIQSKRASGQTSAQEANTIDELERLRSMLGSPRMTIEAVQNILARADKLSGTGRLKPFEPTDDEKKGVVDARKLTTGGGAAAASRPPLSSFFGQ